jgi:methionine synthase I (cobalamin-dependent)
MQDLLSRTPILTDGAWGTQLQRRGLPVGACPDLWNLEQPHAVQAVAEDYVRAGSRVILTNTFGANPFILESHGAAHKTAEIARRGAELSRAAAGSRVRVFGSIGPSGKMLMMEEVTPRQLAEGFALQAQALRDGGVDALICETMTDVEEARIAAEAALGTGLPVVVSMVYDSGAEGTRTMMGNSPADVVCALGPLGLLALGANCGRGASGFHAVCRELRMATAIPLWIKPNAGLPRMTGGSAVYDTRPEDFAREAIQLVAEGASFIGGCCGTSPEFIAALRHHFQ